MLTKSQTNTSFLGKTAFTKVSRSAADMGEVNALLHLNNVFSIDPVMGYPRTIIFAYM